MILDQFKLDDKVAAIDTLDLPDGVRVRDCGAERFWFNYNNWPEQVDGLTLEAAGVRRQIQPGFAHDD